MAGNNSKLNLQGRQYVYRALTNANGVDHFADGTVQRAGDPPKAATRPPGNPWKEDGTPQPAFPPVTYPPPPGSDWQRVPIRCSCCSIGS